MGILAEFLDGEMQHVAHRGHLVGGGGDMLQQLQLALAVVKVAQALLGDTFGLQPYDALALQPPL